MEFSGTWKEIWTQKGLVEGTKNDIRVYDGWEKSQTSMEYISNKIKEVIDLKNNEYILEVGCGAGGMAQYFDSNYVGIDFSKPLTEKCMNFWGKPALYAEANDIPFKDKYFDTSFSWGVFLYFPNKEYMKRVVDEMIRVTKNKIFIGDLPLISHDSKHQTYTVDEFKKMGFQVTGGWSTPYENERFNAYIEL